MSEHVALDTHSSSANNRTRKLSDGQPSHRNSASFSARSSAPPPFSIGSKVRISPTCPIESEGVAPGPGDRGIILAEPAQGDRRACWSIRFESYSVPFSIPQDFLENED